jgi:hypothetical protein
MNKIIDIPPWQTCVIACGAEIVNKGESTLTLHSICLSRPDLLFIDTGMEQGLPFYGLRDDSRFKAAFEVMMRRGWGVEQYVCENGVKQWSVEDGGKPIWNDDDPFTALCDADKWYREHMLGDA